MVGDGGHDWAGLGLCLPVDTAEREFRELQFDRGKDLPLVNYLSDLILCLACYRSALESLI